MENHQESETPTRPKWHLIYYGLAIFDIVTVIATLYLTDLILDIHVDSVAESSVWASRTGNISDLNLLLVSVNTPGNDVFESKQPQQEAQNLENYHQEFMSLYDKVKQEIITIEDKALSEELLAKLEKSLQFESGIVSEARTVFHHYMDGELAIAGNHMAMMDKQFAEASTHLAGAAKKIREIQQELLNEEIEKAKQLKQYEYVIIGLVVLMILCVLVYGHFIARRIQASQKHIDHLLTENSSIISSSPIGIIAIAKDGTINTYNPACEEIFGYSSSEAIGSNCSILMDVHDASHHNEYIDNYHKTGKGTVIGIGREVIGKRKNGKIIPLHLSIRPMNVMEEGDSFFVASIQDLTEQKHLQEELIKAKDVAEHSAKVKSEFLATMSHEIRTPMNGVLGMLNLLKKTELSGEQRQQLNMAKNSAGSLLSIINDILDFSKIEAGKLDLETIEFNLVELLEDVVSFYEIKAEGKHLEIILDTTEIISPFVVGDSSRLRQILNNLIGNALKFTSEGFITIKAKLHKVDDSSFEFFCSVQDTGIGIEREKQASLFDAFSQADSSTTREFGGTGLGLSITKKLCNVMGGGIELQSELGEGACFSFTIKLSPSHQYQHEEGNIKPLYSHAVIIDQNNERCNIISKYLNNFDVLVDEANTIETVFSTLSIKTQGGSSSSIDLALIDCDGSNLDNAEFIKALEGNPFLESIAWVLLMPATKDINISNKSQYHILKKPILEKELEAVLTGRELQVGDESSDLESSAELLAEGKCSGKYALLVEDNFINQEIAKDILEEDLGLTVDIADNGREAIEMLQAAKDKPYDLIFMDCQMPEMDGYEATRAIRAGKAGRQYASIPIIAMTANALKGDKEKCLEAGMSDYVSKPVEPEKVAEVVLELMV